MPYNPTSLANLRPRPPWKPGQGGNARGERAVDKATRQAIRFCAIHTPEMAERLVSMARDENTPAAVRFSAICAVLDRGLGKVGVNQQHGSERETIAGLRIEFVQAQSDHHAINGESPPRVIEFDPSLEPEG